MCLKIVNIVLFIFALGSLSAVSHANQRQKLNHRGGTDQCGCHTDKRTGEYHCHTRKKRGGNCPD
ncbi:YHYH domain-containing protein [Acinetobacter venetianus]|uniref:YHYH domain-containing protein n=1 Tax=Acinetobacter venetianus TaxID=52133 RepID=UPI0010237545|nr:YHYH domain-containing protein [Acinetobacter venetianus]RZG87405.1 YHYH domain-containing protein [Acinetobacter venetianus]